MRKQYSDSIGLETLKWRLYITKPQILKLDTNKWELSLSVQIRH